MCLKSTSVRLQMIGTNSFPNDKHIPVNIKPHPDIQVAIMIVILSLFIGMTILSQADSASAQNTSVNAMRNESKDIGNVNNTIYASGSAFARLQPDRVFISIGVETTEKTANAALSENSELMNGIISELRHQGLMPNETSTSSFNIYPLYNYTESGTRLNVSGFTVTNSIQIESSKLDNVSEWVDTAVASGANNINSIDFTVSKNKLEDTKNRLIIDAIANAEQKADIAASAVGLKVIGVKSINVEGSTTIPPSPPEPFFREDVAAQAGAASPATPILAGEQEVSTSVSAIFLMG
jgi:uncharacterized protein YggE